MGSLAKNHNTDFVFLQIEGDPNGVARKRHHLVVHNLGEAIDLGYAIPNGQNLAGIGSDRFILEISDLLFNLFYDGTHYKCIR